MVSMEVLQFNEGEMKPKCVKRNYSFLMKDTLKRDLIPYPEMGFYSLSLFEALSWFLIVSEEVVTRNTMKTSFKKETDQVCLLSIFELGIVMRIREGDYSEAGFVIAVQQEGPQIKVVRSSCHSFS